MSEDMSMLPITRNERSYIELGLSLAIKKFEGISDSEADILTIKKLRQKLIKLKFKY